MAPQKVREEIELGIPEDLIAAGADPIEVDVRPKHRCFQVDCAICAEAEQRAERARRWRAKWTRCRCGVRNCDCARWEAIYKAKFEDPTYYENRVQTPQSSIRSL